MSVRTAPREELYELHRLLCAELLRRLQEKNPSAAVLAVARSVLRDNAITAKSHSDMLSGLAELTTTTLPDFTQ